jgi:hypothetical protein
MANAVQVVKNTKDGGSAHAVGVGDLRVMIICDGETEWYAQGLEIDYLAQGENKEAVQKAFERGLQATIAEHIKLHGHIKKLLRPAEPEVWEEFYRHTAGAHFKFTQISVHAFKTPGDEHVFVATTKVGKSKSKSKSKPSRQEGSEVHLPFKRLPFSGITFIQACA